LIGDFSRDTNSASWTDPTKVYFPPITATFGDEAILKYAARNSAPAGKRRKGSRMKIIFRWH